MTRCIRMTLIAAAALAAFAGAAAPAATAGEIPEKFKIGDRAPDFTLRDLDGREVRLSSFAGNKVVLLAFWSLRCGACLQEVPFLEQIHTAYRAKGVAVLSVVTDGVGAGETGAIIKEVGAALTYPVLVDPDFTVSDTFTNFVVPYTLVIDRSGVIRYQHTGFETGTQKQYEAALALALGS